MKNNHKWQSAIVGSLSLLLLLVVWEVLGRQTGAPLASVLPPPSIFLSSIIENNFQVGLGSQSVTVDQAIISSLLRVFGGMMIAFFLALATGALLSLSKIASWATLPVLHLFAPIAPIAWVPLGIVVFGINNITAIFIVFMGVYFILTLATLAEIKRVPAEYLVLAQNMGATPLQQWTRVIFPAILPGVFTLLRINFVAAWMAVLVAEMVGLRDGIGAIIMMGRNLFNSELIMFGILLIGVCGALVDRVLRWIQHRFLWWAS